MLRYLQITFAIATASCLVAFGWSQVAGPGSGSGNSPAGAGGVRQLVTSEAQYMSQLSLNKQQQQEYARLNQTVAAAYEDVKQIETLDGRLKRASEISHAREDAIRKLLSKAQYAKYDELLEGSIPKTAGVFGGTDVEILNTLGLSDAQWKNYREFRQQMDAANHRLYRLNRTDATGAAWFSTEINLMSRQGIQKILTPVQWHAYKDAWDRIMSPYLRGSGSGSSSAAGGGG